MSIVQQCAVERTEKSHPTMLEAALGYAAGGYHVFPLMPEAKTPFPGTRGKDEATDDAAQIRQWWSAHPNANIGLSLRPSRLVVVDTDTYKSECGWAGFVDDKDVPETWTQETGRGGHHYIFSAPDEADYEGRLKGIKGVEVIRNGYIVAAPSQVAGGTYKRVNEAPPAAAPEWVPRRPTVPETPSEQLQGHHDDVEQALARIPNDDLDWEEWNSIGMALFNATGGSDAGCGLFAAWSQASEKNDPAETFRRWAHYRKSPPDRIGAGSLYYKARQHDPAWHPSGPSPEEVFGDAQPSAEGEPRSIRATPFQLLDAALISPRRFLYGRCYIPKFVSLIVAPGGVGKTAFTIAEALAIATGKDLLGHPVYGGPHRVWLWNLEDPADELQRRFTAACQHYGITQADLGGDGSGNGRLYVDSGRVQELNLATQGPNGVQVQDSAVDSIVRELHHRRIDVLIIDPFVSSHSVPENDNAGIDRVAKTLGRIADKANCAVVVVHHSRKLNGEQLTAEAARGASALLAAARSGRVLSRMTEKEASRLGVEQARSFFQAIDDKANLAPPVGEAEWYKLVNVALSNGDQVGVVERWAPPEPSPILTPTEREAILQAIQAAKPEDCRKDPQSPQWVGRIVAKTMGLDFEASADKKRTATILDGLMADGWLEPVPFQDRGRRKRPCVQVSEQNHFPLPHTSLVEQGAVER